uniref:Myosin IXB n=1 Tax=Denticeps clupeoides TaxID=299321 RepID=A0AAY4DEK6_9TELE
MNVSDGDGAASQDGRAYELQIYPRLAQRKEACCSLKVSKEASAASVIQDVAAELGLDSSKRYVLAEVKESGGEEWVLEANDLPVHRVLLWPRKAQERHPQREGFYFLLQERNHDGTIRYVHLSGLSKEQEAKQLVARGFLPPRQEDFDDLCNLPELKEDTILDNLRIRFHKKKIYTYAGSILIAINPFKFLPIYNPKYVKMYENHQLGKLEPHIFAIADVAYYTMLRKHVNQCIVISGESGSGKTQSTNFLIHCLTALSQKGYASGVERTILGAGPVLEAFGNAKTAHNNNSSRFGKFIQVNYLESGVVRGAVVEKYLLEKSRLVSREKNERNYHVFYYLLMGATDEERKEFKLLHPEDYLYLKQQSFKIEDEEDICHDFERLQQAMEMVGFLPATKKQIFSVLSAILYLGNVTYRPKSNGRDEGLDVGPPDVLTTLSDLLRVKEELLVEALTKRKTVTVNDKLILPYSHSQAITARDSMAKSLYSALFDWIVLRINHALLNKKDMEESVPCLSIGVLDIFGFEDFATNSFEQFCINYANEQLQYYFNQHIFKLEQEEYKAEGITWHNIDYTDNVGCIHLISRKPTGLLQLLDEESNFPHATDKTLLAKFKQQHNNNKYFVDTPVMEPAFVIRHFAGTVKYQIKDFREKNTDFMRPDIVALLRSSDRAYVRQLIGMDPVAMFRWGILRATIRAMAAFNEAGRHWAAKTAGVRRPSCRTPLGELQTANTPIEKIYRYEDMHTQIINSIKDLQLDCEDPRKLLQSWGRLRFPRHLLQKNKGTKQKQLIPKNLLDSCTLKFIVSLTLHDRTTKSLLHLHKKKKPPSISAQFQTSLSKLLETLGKAEPFFIRCLRSNSEKKEMFFDETLIVQQLRYTGMLETVRIRRSGYGAKYTFQDFLEQFRVLLPRNSCASQEDISVLLQKLGLDNCNYQIGKTKVFLKEPERQKLQDALHMDVMCKILFLQHWFRAKLKRREYLQKRASAVIIQHCWRRFRKERLRQAAILLQAQWRGYSQRVAYQGQLACILRIQALTRGNLARRSPDQQEIQDVGRSPVQPHTERMEGIQSAPHSHKVNSTPTQASPEAGLKQSHQNKVSGQVPEEQRTNEVLLKPDRSMEQTAAIVADTMQPRTPQLGKLPPSRSQEKRELRRQRGLEHTKLVIQRTASVNNDDSASMLKGQDSPSAAEGKLKERSDSKELDQYTFVAWKEKGKKEIKNPPPFPVRPCTLPLDSPNTKRERNGHKESSSPSSPSHGTLQGSHKPGDSQDKTERGKMRRSETEPENLSPESQIPRNRKTNLQYVASVHCILQGCHSPLPSQPSRPHQHPEATGGRLVRNPTIKISRATRVKEWDASLNREITNANELRHLDELLGNQVESHFIIDTFLAYGQQKPHHSYRVLMNSYELKVIALAGEKQKSEVQLVVNLFQSVLDGFIRGEMKKGEAEQVKFDSPLDHMFSTYQVSIMQSCDQCFSYIWAMEKACMCSFCKMVCHKKCLSKITTDCTSNYDPNSQHFGVRLCHLINDKTPVPVVLAIMLEHIEMNGLYSEGIYRKSGSANRMKELYQRLQADPNSVCLEDYPIHTVTGLVKQWLRELPDPLMTFTHYSDFLRATELPEKLDQIPAIYKVLELLPPSHFNTLERLIFHLVRVSKEEVNNRMNPNSLAIVFAPCILRCPDSADPLMSMKDVAKTTMCVEMIINEQIRKYNDKMEEIEQLEYAEALAVNQLKLKRQATVSRSTENDQTCLLHILYMKSISASLAVFLSPSHLREDLAFRLPELEQPGSDQENLDSEASLSSESLLDDRSINSDTEEPRPVCLPEPPDSALRPKPMSVGPTSALLSAERLQTQRRIPIIPGTVKLPHGVTASATAMPPSSLQTWSLAMVQRRIQPGRRKDSIQSLYIAPGSELSASPPSVPCDLQSAATTKRRFSNPDIPYIDD